VRLVCGAGMACSSLGIVLPKARSAVSLMVVTYLFANVRLAVLLAPIVGATAATTATGSAATWLVAIQWERLLLQSGLLASLVVPPTPWLNWEGALLSHPVARAQPTAR